MAGINLSVTMPRRKATVNIGKYRAETLGINEGDNPCYVLGLFQCVEADDCAYPVFVCELEDGRVIETSTCEVRFVEENDEGGTLA